MPARRDGRSGHDARGEDEVNITAWQDGEINTTGRTERQNIYMQGRKEVLWESDMQEW